VTPGDLFYINAAADTRDITVNLYLTNANELSPCLRYLIMKVGMYCESSDGQWIKVPPRNSKYTSDTFITLRNSPVSFTLSGGIRYKVTIDSGSFYCLSTSTNKGTLSPQFYITAESM